MEKLLFNVGTAFCAECALALHRFVGGIEGVDSIDIECEMVVVKFDSDKIADEDLIRITKDSIEKLGYKLL